MSDMNIERARAERKRLEAEEGKTVSLESHPICQNAVDKAKCELFVERLDQASNNIDLRHP